MPLVMLGTGILWFGWFGFNAGSNLEANGGAALAMTNSFVATAAAALAWMFAEWIIKGHPSLLGALSGAVAGLVAVTPAAGYAGPMGAIVLGLVVGVVCLFFCTVVKNALGYDDSLDVFGVHAVGGILGALLTGPFDKADPQVALRVAADYGEPATVENIADWLHDETVECIHCNRRWLFTDDDAPAYWNDSGRLCEECAPCTTRGQRDPDGWKLEAGR